MTPEMTKLRMMYRGFQDLQKLRIQSGNRNTTDEVVLDDADKVFFEGMGNGLEVLEKSSLKAMKRILKGIPIWKEWLDAQLGIGPAISAFLVAEINIEKCETASQLWSWMGLKVVVKNCPFCGGKPGNKCSVCQGKGTVGQADRRFKGQRADYDPKRKAKVLYVMGGCLTKANDAWKKVYDGRKHRRQHQMVALCMGCGGTGRRKGIIKGEDGKTEEKGKEVECWNCGGTGGPAPWGRDDKHRHLDATRYMVKMFLLELWKQWRTIEGLPVRESYAVEKLGMAPHSGGAS